MIPDRYTCRQFSFSLHAFARGYTDAQRERERVLLSDGTYQMYKERIYLLLLSLISCKISLSPYPHNDNDNDDASEMEMERYPYGDCIIRY